MKIALRKIVGNCKLSFEELTTVLVEAEATLNSRPLLPIDSMSTDGAPVLTPGHFLVGHPLRSLWTQTPTSVICDGGIWSEEYRQSYGATGSEITFASYRREQSGIPPRATLSQETLC